jgi:hypothetical protein
MMFRIQDECICGTTRCQVELGIEEQLFLFIDQCVDLAPFR